MKLKRIILISLTSASGLATWIIFNPKKVEKPVYDKYNFLQRVQTNQVSEDEIFSEEIDTIFYDRLGIKNVRFKNNFNLKEKEL
jgi:hypothetical protein